MKKIFVFFYRVISGMLLLLAVCPSLRGEEISGDRQGWIDTHIHLYDTRREGSATFLDPQRHQKIYTPHLAEQFVKATANTGVGYAVVVEASRRREDNFWVLNHVDTTGVLLAFIGNLDPRDSWYEEDLDSLSKSRKFRGIRIRPATPVDLSDPSIIERFGELAARNLVLELGVSGVAPETVKTIARRYPGMNIIINHLAGGKLPAGAAFMKQWKARLEGFASEPNVYCKVSALYTLSGREPAPVRAEFYRPLIDPVVDAFGPDRVLFGSNWTLSEMGGSYADLISFLEDYCEERPGLDPEQLFYKNAVRAYGIPLPGEKTDGDNIRPVQESPCRLIPWGETRVALRPLPVKGWADKEGTYEFCAAHLDMSYEGESFFNTRIAFPEFYIDWQEGEMDTNPATNRMVRLIEEKEKQGIEVYGFKIAREVMVGMPAGPIKDAERILYKSDVEAIRKVLKAAKAAGILKRDDYKLIQMINPPMAPKTPSASVITNNPEAREVILMMDGVCEEIHHFWHGYFRPEKDITQKDIDETVKDALWTLSQGLDFVFYYGPFRWHPCQEYPYDMFRGWLESYWEAGLPKYHKNMIYDLNAFPHDCGSSRPVAPESDPESVAGLCKWLIEQVKFKREP